jgi:hypothetical protein
MAKPATLPPFQATSHVPEQAHLPTQIPPLVADDPLIQFAPPTLPSQASSTALDHVPTEIPPPPHEIPPPFESGSTLPLDATDNMSPTATSHVPDWLLPTI